MYQAVGEAIEAINLEADAESVCQFFGSILRKSSRVLAYRIGSSSEGGDSSSEESGFDTNPGSGEAEAFMESVPVGHEFFRHVKSQELNCARCHHRSKQD